MKAKLLLMSAMIGLSIAARATDPEALNVHVLNDLIHSTYIDNVQSIKFNEEETTMLVNLFDQQVQPYNIADIRYMQFSDYIEDSDIETKSIETLSHSVSNTGKVIENNQVIIVNNGVRYNVLGIKL